MKKIFTAIVLSLGISAPLLLAQITFAQATAPTTTPTSDASNQVCEGIGLANGTKGGCDEKSGGGKGVMDLVAAAINILSIVVGVAAVIMVMIGGFKYVTAGGDSNAIGSAKTTITYALIGLIIAFMAQIIVHFVLYSLIKPANSPVPSPPGATSRTV